MSYASLYKVFIMFSSSMYQEVPNNTGVDVVDCIL